MPFDLETGKSTVSFDGPDYGTMTADFLLKKMKADPKVVAVTAAVPAVFGFTAEKREEAGSQFVDVGIAEEHAIALSSGIAAAGGKPVFATYSSFIQRTFDQLSQDLCINQNPATVLIFAASVYGMNDVTHLGIYDIPLISNIPNMVYLAPTNQEEYFAMLEWSMKQTAHPVAIRVPANGVLPAGAQPAQDYSQLNQYQVTQKGSQVAILALGDFYQMGEAAAKLLEEKTGATPTLINPRFITGQDTDLLDSLKQEHRVIVTLEDGILDGGFGEKIARFYGAGDTKVLNFGLKKEFLDRYRLEDVLQENHLTPEQIVADIEAVIS